ncbi:hypothetical protein [Variovorax paradoxus]|uniref:hypothetical protein n=1 Tax=Variovorax paradoxus TaxID=34073 RepID=UPI00193478ED|nr:hypothetical protein INQ48_43635 [Variovorax paradoxus]
MSKSAQHSSAAEEERGPTDDLFDETFLASVDREMLLLKEHDPCRLRRLPYAVEEDIRHDRSALIHQDRPKVRN